MTFGEQLVLRGLASYGEREVAGPGRNSYVGRLIDRWFRKDADDSTTAWCAIWLAEQVEKCGGEVPSVPFRAKSWAAWGHEVLTPRLGAIVVLRRGPGLFHVAIAVRHDAEGYLWCLGGNQANSVSIAKYPAAAIYAIREVA